MKHDDPADWRIRIEPLPIAAQVWQQLNALMAQGWGREDTASLLRVLEAESRPAS